MRICFVIGTVCAAGILVSCGFGYNTGSEVKDVGDIVSMIRSNNPGYYNVVCNDNTFERVSDLDIRINNVCPNLKVTPDNQIRYMQKRPDGDYEVVCVNGSEKVATAAEIQAGNVCEPVPTPTPTPTLVVTQVNPKAFNAFNIWRDGQGSEILDYPQGYGVQSGSITPDGVFYVENPAYWKDRKFIGVPTEGAKVIGEVLEYPSRNGRELKIKFSPASPVSAGNLIVTSRAIAYCKDQGLRLPTVRELFDFCAAGVTEPNYGPNFESDKYPSTGRCGKQQLRSASGFNSSVWRFGYPGASVELIAGAQVMQVRCVGAP